MKYSVLTFIFGKYEVLHEVLNVQPNVEYICVTDNKNLKSATWKIIYDEINPQYTPFRKVVEVRYNPFKYVTTNTCVVIDGSIQIVKFPYILLSAILNGKYDIALLVHPNRSSLLDEINAWKTLRNLSELNVNVCKKLLSSISYDKNYKGLFQVGFFAVKNTPTINKLFRQVLSMNNACAKKNDTFRVDQILFSALVNKYFSTSLKIFPMTSDELYGKYFTYFKHGTYMPIRTNIINHFSNDYNYVFNQRQKCYLIDEISHLNNDITAAICNFNTTQLTNTVIEGLIQNSTAKNIIILDNSNKVKFVLDQKFATHKNIKILDNTTSKYINFDKLLKTYRLSTQCKSNNYASLKHAMSIQFLLSICTSKYLLLCDSDIIIKRTIDFIEDGYVTIADVERTGQASQNMNINLGKSRFVPFMQLFNVKLMNLYNIKYFDINRIHGIEQGIQYDTGASFYEDVVERKHFQYKYINIEQYITHLGHGSWK